VARFPALTDPDDLLQESYMRLLRARAAGNVVNTFPGINQWRLSTPPAAIRLSSAGGRFLAVVTSAT
jgi:hypothetical protein